MIVSRRTLGVLAVMACITAAVAFGPGIRSHLHHSATLAKAGVEPDQRAKKYLRSNQATASDEKLPASLQAAEEAYAARAYPAADVPFQLTVNSQQSWKQTQQRGWENWYAG